MRIMCEFIYFPIYKKKRKCLHLIFMWFSVFASLSLQRLQHAPEAEMELNEVEKWPRCIKLRSQAPLLAPLQVRGTRAL